MRARLPLLLVMILGALAAMGIWLWALADSFDPWRFVAGLLATVVLVVTGGVLAKMIIRRDSRLSSDALASSAFVVALAPLFVGLQILAFEALGGRRGGPPQHVDRRYSLLFFGLAVYFAVFPMLTRLLLRSSPSPHLKLHPSDTGAWLKR